jgi:hypothetical protein
MPNTRRQPVNLSKLTIPACWPWHGRLSFRLIFGKADGPAIVRDGRGLTADLEDHELADLLGQIPASALDIGSMMALGRMLDLLKGEPSKFTGVRKDDLATLLTATADDPAPGKVLARLREAAGLEPATAATATNGDAPDAR